LSGRLIDYLRQHFTVKWRLTAISGLDSPGLANLLGEARADRFDVVVLSIGVNDVTRLRSPSQWLQCQNKLANIIQLRFKPHLLIHSAIPPMQGFTALPQPLRWFMGRWALEMNRRLEATLSGNTGRILHWPFREAASEGLSADGFHPGSVGYDMWAEGLSRVILLAQINRLLH
jgi:lysophospholipase L1-like esterase